MKQPRATASFGNVQVRQRGYFAAHWHGDHSLAVSYWINTFFLSIPLNLAVGGLAYWMTQKGDFLRSSAIATLVGWPLMVSASVWCYVGVWRAAKHHTERGASAFWSRVAMGIVVLSFINLLASTSISFLPQVANHIKMARGVDPLGNATLTISDDGRSIQLLGPIGAGDAVRFRNLTEGASAIRVLTLDSPGGRVYEAKQIAELVGERKWRTRATGGCESACTLVFLAGVNRAVLQAGRLGFHRASAGTLNPLIEQLVNRELADTYEKGGLPATFIQRTMMTPPSDMWYPSTDEMVDGGLINASSKTLEVSVPPANGSSIADFEDALSGNMVWSALEARYPNTIHSAAQNMLDARLGGVPDEVVMAEAYRIIQQLLPDLLQTTSQDARDEYLLIFAQQLQIAHELSESMCQRALEMDPLARATMPTVWLARESTWLLEASRQFQTRLNTPPPTELELEVVRRSLGEGAPQLLNNLLSSTSNTNVKRNCKTYTILIDRFTRLSREQRKLAARFVFQNGKVL